MEESVKVPAEEVLRSSGSVRPHNYLQLAGVNLAIAVGSVGAVVILALITKWWITYPSAPTLPVGIEPDKAKALIENYRQLQEVSVESILKVSDALIVKLLLPLFTSIVGYIFGSSERMK
jgi:hypothetical protein